MYRPPWRMVIVAALLACSGGAQAQRMGSDNGAYYALVIGINQYQRISPPLQTAVDDAKAIDDVLRQRYGFQSTLLVDAAATRANILQAFVDYRLKLRENDNLVIYYAGHGKSEGNEAYWLPVDSDPVVPTNWIIATEVTKGIKLIPARHILLISDSCYSGSLTRGVTTNAPPPSERARYIQTMLANKSRVLISSGRDEPVADGGSSGHSVFANAILNGLRNNPDQTFTASNLFDRYVQEAVVGGSQQVPLFKVIPDSGHEFGDFVFIARGAAVSGGGAGAPNRPPERTPPPPTPRPSGTLPHVSDTRLAADGRAISAGPADPDGYLPLTYYRAALLEFRDFPETMTDAYMQVIARSQVVSEQSNWKLLDAAAAGKPLLGFLPPGLQLNPQRSKFVFEWQKEIAANPALARSLLGVFLRPDADWSFLKKQQGWDEQFDAFIYVFLFARDQVEGRQPDFVARNLAPVMKQHLQAAVAQAPVKLYFDVNLRTRYDVPQGAIRLLKLNSEELADSLEILSPTAAMTFSDTRVDKLPPPTDRDYKTFLPATARTAANYNLSMGLEDTPEARPGVIIVGDSPQQGWRKGMPGETFDHRMAPLGGFALDRQLKLGVIPFDPKKAEPIFNALRSLKARVFLNADRISYSRVGYERQWKPLQSWLSAKVQKVEILGPKDEVLATIPGSSLPAATAR